VNRETQVLALFEEGNPVPDLDTLEPVDIDAAAYLATLEQRSTKVNQTVTKSEKRNDRKRSRSLWLVAAAVVVLVAGASIIFVNQNDEDSVASQQAFGSALALDVTRSFIAAFNAGELPEMLALFTDDATYSDSSTPVSARPDWEPQLAWFIAMETMLLSSTCAAGDEIPGVSVTVTCEYGSQDAVRLAADSIVDIKATLTIVPGGIQDLHENSDGSLDDYGVAGEPFNIWLEANHPEDADTAGCCQGESVEESVTRGELRAKYANVWAIYLKTNN
jgi:hypothetical protein